MNDERDSGERNPLDDYYLELGPIEMSTEQVDDDKFTFRVRQQSRLIKRPTGDAKIVD